MSLNIPSSFGLDVDMDLGANLNVNIPTSYTVDLRPIEVKPIDVSLRLKEIPSVRAHYPLNFKIGFSLLGRELACIDLCGHGQFITEPYRPYPCEPDSATPKLHLHQVPKESPDKNG